MKIEFSRQIMKNSQTSNPMNYWETSWFIRFPNYTLI